MSEGEGSSEPRMKKSRSTEWRHNKALEDAVTSAIARREQSSSTCSVDTTRAEHTLRAEKVVDTKDTLLQSEDFFESEVSPPSQETELPTTNLDGDTSYIQEGIEDLPHHLPEDESEPGFQIFDHLPLYENAPLTVAESLVAIMTLCITHSLTGSCVSDILSLISLHCIKPNLCKTSLYLFKKYFERSKVPLVRHFFCSICYSSLESKTTKCKNQTCLSSSAKPLYFLQMPIKDQLQCMLKRRDFWEKLTTKRKKQNDSNINDICDGSVYQNLVKKGIFNGHSYSFLWFSDGVPVFKSSKHDIWPLYLVINELPYKDRFSYENMILAGLWFGKEKPEPKLYLEPFSKELRMLSSGHSFLNYLNSTVKMKFFLLCGTCDLPAKSLFLNFTQFNGEFGCPKCLHPGIQLKLPNQSRGSVRVFPFVEPPPPDRTHQETLADAKLAVESGKPQKGVKGISPLVFLVPDIIMCTAIDIMHGVFGGVMKKLMSLWFKPKHSSQPFSMSAVVSVIDQRLKKITPPNFVKRIPRTVQDLSFWKASEYKYMFFYYAIPIFHGIMKREYLVHFIKLVKAIYLLNMESISMEMISEANVLLCEFVKDYERLYSQRYMTINVHQLLHLPKAVEEMGPLFMTSCFHFEDFNGKLLTFAHGTTHTDLQICSSVSSLLGWTNMKASLKSDSPVLKFLESARRKHIKFCETIESGTSYIVGITNVIHDLPQSDGSALTSAGFALTECSYFKYYRLFINETLYISEEYDRTSKTFSACIKFKFKDQTHFGVVKYFLKIISKDSTTTQHFAIITLYLPVEGFDRSVLPPFLHVLADTNTVVAVPIPHLEALCFKVNVDENCFIVQPVNSLEVE